MEEEEFLTSLRQRDRVMLKAEILGHLFSLISATTVRTPKHQDVKACLLFIKWQVP